jgi:hypothetical protein
MGEQRDARFAKVNAGLAHYLAELEWGRAERRRVAATRERKAKISERAGQIAAEQTRINPNRTGLSQAEFALAKKIEKIEADELRPALVAVTKARDGFASNFKDLTSARRRLAGGSNNCR